MSYYLPPNVNHAIAAGLAGFAHRHELGSRRLSKICGGAGGVSAGSAGRLLAGKSGLKLVPRARTQITAGVTSYLKGRGISNDEIQKELTAILTGDLEPVTTPRTALSMDAQQFFHLRRDPFALTSDPKGPQDAFTSKTLDRIVDHIEDCIRYQGFVCCIGDIGSGKSTLKARINDLVKNSKGSLNVLWPTLADMGRVTSGSIVHYILEEFNQRPKLRLVSAQRQLEKLLAEMSEKRRSVALGFDEAHHLSDQTLSALKNFYELGTGGFDRYLGVVLFAQPRFLDRLEDHRFQEITERLDIIRMPSLAKQDDAWRYVVHRLKLVGGNAEKLFDRGVIDRIVKVVSTPLALGNLANAALEKAHEFNQHRVTTEILKTVLSPEESEPRVRAINRRG